MNDLRAWFDSLKSFEKERLRSRLGGSELALKLLDFLSSGNRARMGTSDMVKVLYPDELASEPYSALQNRFYKLKKKVVDALSVAIDPGDQSSMTGEEKRLLKCRRLINENHFSLAISEIVRLKDDCLSNNIFELLPDIISYEIFCRQVINDFEGVKGLFEEYERSVKLRGAASMMQLHSRKAFHLVITEGYKAASEELKKIYRISREFSSFPRFRLSYHFSSFTTGSASMGNTKFALVRHYSAILKIIKAHPEMPAVIYEPGYLRLQKYYLLNSKATFDFICGELRSAYDSFTEAWDILDKSEGLRVKKSENHFRNKVHMEIAVGKYHDALQTLKEWISYKKSFDRNDPCLLPYYEMAFVYTYGWPSLKPHDYRFLTEKLKIFIKELKKSDPLRLINEVKLTLACFYFIQKKIEYAVKVISDKELKMYLDHHGFGFYYRMFLLMHQRENKKLDQLKNELTGLKQKNCRTR